LFRLDLGQEIDARNLVIVVNDADSGLLFWNDQAGFGFLRDATVLPGARQNDSAFLASPAPNQAGFENTGNKRGHGSAGSTGLKMGQSC
jgi:hypothetical protein